MSKAEEIEQERIIAYWNRLYAEQKERERDPEAAKKRDQETFLKNLNRRLNEGDPYGDWA